VATTLWDVFRRSLVTNADRRALHVGGREWTYRELGHAVAVAVEQLRESGVRPGDRVVLLMVNEVGFPVLDLAVMALGAVKVPLNSALTAAEVADVVTRVRARVVIVSPALLPLVVAVDPSLVRSTEIDWTSPAPDLPMPGAAGPDDPAVIYFTGGTTGRPKGVVHSQQGTVANLWAHLLEGDIRRDERLLLTTPLPHAAGLFTLSTLLRGAYAHIEPAFDADLALDLLNDRSITWTFAVPTTIYRMLDAADRRGWRPTTLRTLQYGAAPIAAAQLRRALDCFGPVLQQLYAQTECPNYGSALRKEAHVQALEEPALLRSAGVPSIMCDVSIRADDGEPLPVGEVGEVCLRAPYVMTGYWEDEEAARERFHGGWLRTGDVGYLDEDSFLYLVDRRKDMIITGGMNVYSIEVEQALTQHESVASAALVGIPYADRGEAVHALVVPSGTAPSDETVLREHCRQALAGYKRPKTYEFVESLPLTVYGKADKKAIRARYWAELDRAIS
jgi:fatty-acyl-CoA synthase/long-chain acyl-CoA synthetase